MKKLLLSIIVLMSVSFFVISVSSAIAGDPVIKKDNAAVEENSGSDDQLEEFEEPQVPEGEEGMEYQQDYEDSYNPQEEVQEPEDTYYEEKWDEEPQKPIETEDNVQ